jgi:hypothetical protein
MDLLPNAGCPALDVFQGRGFLFWVPMQTSRPSKTEEFVARTRPMPMKICKRETQKAALPGLGAFSIPHKKFRKVLI